MKKKILLSTILTGALFGSMAFSNVEAAKNMRQNEEIEYVNKTMKEGSGNIVTKTIDIMNHSEQPEEQKYDNNIAVDLIPTNAEAKNGVYSKTYVYDFGERNNFRNISSVDQANEEDRVDVYRTIQNLYQDEDWIGGDGDEYANSGYFWDSEGMESDDWKAPDDHGDRHQLIYWRNGGHTPFGKMNINPIENEWAEATSSKSPYQLKLHDKKGNPFPKGENAGSTNIKLQYKFEGLVISLRLYVKNSDDWEPDDNSTKVSDIYIPPLKVKGEIDEYDIATDVFDEEGTEEQILRGKKIWTSEMKISDFSQIIKDSVISEKGFVTSEQTKVVFYKSMTSDEVIYDSYEDYDEKGQESLWGPDYFFEFDSSGISTSVPELVEDADGSGNKHENVSKRYHLTIPFIKDFGISLINELGASESGTKSSFIFKDSSDLNEGLDWTEFNLYLNDDYKIWFETKGWVKGVKYNLDYDENFTPTLIGNFIPDPSNEYAGLWEQEIFIEEDSDVSIAEGEEGILEEVGEYDDGGWWVPLQNMDEIYSVSNVELGEGEKWHQERLLRQRWSLDIKPKYIIDNDEEFSSDSQQIGRVLEGKLNFKAMEGKSLEGERANDSVYDSDMGVLEEYTINVAFDSTPMLDKFVNQEEGLFYSSEDTYQSADAGSDVNNFHGPTGTYDVTQEDGTTIIEDVEIENAFDMKTNTDKYGNTWIGEGTFDEENWDTDPSHWLGTGDDPTTKDLDESWDDTSAQWISGGNVEPVVFEHVITTDEQVDPTFEDVYFVEIGEGNLPSFLGDDNVDGEISKRWWLDYEFVIESNPFIQDISYEDWEYGDGNAWYKKGFVKRTVTINEGSDTLPTKTFETVVAEELNNEVKKLALEGRSDYFRDGDGQDLIYNMQQRGLVKIPSDYDPEETSINQLMIDFALSELDAESTKIQWEAMKDSRDINEWLASDDIQEDYSEISFIDGKTNEEVIQWIVFLWTLEENYNFKPGNSIDMKQQRDMKELINETMPKTIYNDEIVNRDEWKVDFDGLYQVENGDWGYSGIELVEDEEKPSGFRIVISDVDKVKNWGFEIDKKDPGYRKSSIQESTFHYEDGVKIKGHLTVARFNIEHQVTRHSTLVGEGEIFIPLFVTEKTTKSIVQYDQSKLEEIEREIEHLFDIYGRPEISNWEDYINPKDRENFRGGDYDYGYGQPGDLVNNYHGEDEEFGAAEKYGNWKDEDGNWTGYGDDPTTEDVDESEDDEYKPFELTRKDYLSFIYEQNEWSQEINPETGDYDIKKTTNAFSWLVYQISQFSEYDIEVEWLINGQTMDQLNSRELLLKDDELTLIVKPNSDSSQSRWIVQGEASYTFGVWIPKGLEIPEVQKPVDPDKDGKQKHVSLLVIIIVIIFVSLITTGLIIWFRKSKSNKVLIE